MEKESKKELRSEESASKLWLLEIAVSVVVSFAALIVASVY